MAAAAEVFGSEVAEERARSSGEESSLGVEPFGDRGGGERGERSGDVDSFGVLPFFLELRGESGGDCDPKEDEGEVTEAPLRTGDPGGFPLPAPPCTPPFGLLLDGEAEEEEEEDVASAVASSTDLPSAWILARRRTTSWVPCCDIHMKNSSSSLSRALATSTGPASAAALGDASTPLPAPAGLEEAGSFVLAPTLVLTDSPPVRTRRDITKTRSTRSQEDAPPHSGPIRDSP